ncbi:MAG: sigma 54-interacting transcriptional regulator [Spirochaetaceae bacterium]|jgi:Nif-specific regulatory protein|nr:sigma 54-interacting transcriptional regulator [Spirochaetaceae bacterium]
MTKDAREGEAPLSGGDEAAWERIELRMLFDIARTFDKHLEFRAAFGPLLGILEDQAGLSRGMVTLLDRASGLLRVVEARGLSPGEKSGGVFRLGAGAVGRVFESAAPLTVPDLARGHDSLPHMKNRTREDLSGCSWYCVPVCSGADVTGTLSAERRHGEGSRERRMKRDRALLEKAAALIADAAKFRERMAEERARRAEDAGEDAAPRGRRVSPESPIIGTGSRMREVYEMISRVAPSGATVLITGESGTGKELVAAELHRLSKRAGAAFIKVNCAALPESVIESELFGHEKGAFTGAAARRQGRFELAHRGTIFLDEIGELSPAVQAKLLRVLQEREFERVGGDAVIKIDVRLIAATNRKLDDEVRTGRFREDLFYRLNVFPLHIPPLRERKGDIMLLADHFAEKYAERNGKRVKRISGSAIDLLTGYAWPGNVRELENCIERAVILTEDMVIHSYHLPPSLQSPLSTSTEPTTTLDAALSRVEKDMIIDALKISGGNMALAARQLGITGRRMGLRVHHYGINWRLYRTVT